MAGWQYRSEERAEEWQAIYKKGGGGKKLGSKILSQLYLHLAARAPAHIWTSCNTMAAVFTTWREKGAAIVTAACGGIYSYTFVKEGWIVNKRPYNPRGKTKWWPYHEESQYGGRIEHLEKQNGGCIFNEKKHNSSNLPPRAFKFKKPIKSSRIHHI